MIAKRRDIIHYQSTCSILQVLIVTINSRHLCVVEPQLAYDF